MWKDYFYFSNPQKGGILILLILIITVLILNYALPLIFPSSEMNNTAFPEEVAAFRKKLLSRDSLMFVEQEKRQRERKKQYNYSSKQKPTENYSLFSFDPNTADSITFIQLGLDPHIASNILKYRLKGGMFKISDDFRKIYGISNNKYIELEPYIVINEIAVVEKNKNNPDDFSIPHTGEDDIIENLVVELNAADTIELMQIKGIGKYYARQIIKFRNETGGFYSVEQLKEIKNMSTENFEKICQFCQVDTQKVRKINVNTATVDYLKRHPYITFYQAKAIYEFRKIKGKLNGINDLRRFNEFSEEDMSRLQHYLSFE